MKAQQYILVLIALFNLTACGGGGGGGDGGNGGGNGAGGGVFLVAGDGEQWSSTDAQTWSEIFGIPNSVNTRDVATGNGVIVWVGSGGVGSFGRTYATTALSNPNYTRIQLGDFTVASSVIFANGIFVMTGSQSNNAAAWTSTDGVNWNFNTIAGHSASGRVAFGNNMFITGCRHSTTALGEVCFSADGVVWQSVAFTNGNIVSVAFGNGMFVATGLFRPTGSRDLVNAIWTSTDGMNWSGAVTIEGQALFNGIGGITFGNGVWVAVGLNSGLGKTWISQDNGQTWQARVIGGLALSNVRFLNGKFIAVGRLGHIITSTDGLTWQNHDLPFGGGNLSSVTFMP